MYKHRLVRLALILTSAIIAVVGTDLVSQYIFTLPEVNTIYLVVGFLLSYFTITFYNKIVAKKKVRIEGELRDVTDVVLKNYNIRD